MARTFLKLNDPGYDICISDKLLHLNAELNITKNYSKTFVLVDTNTSRYCMPLLKKCLNNFIVVKIRAGEDHKNFDTLQIILKALIKNSADRKSLLINLGGGVICDMGGFAASIYKRGIDFINIPTTLLSMVDSSVGGKLGIDLLGFKNAAGLFQNPKAVFIAKEFLNTLTEKQIYSGFAEMLKHGLIADRKYFTRLSKTNPVEVTIEDITSSIKIKTNLVIADFKEQNVRKLLNAGHTIGHAVESVYLESGRKKWLHGYCVAAGIIMESFIALNKRILSKKDFEEIQNTILKKFKFEKIKPGLIPGILKFSRNDKKNSNGHILCSLPASIGTAKFDITLNEKDIISAVHYFNSIL